MPPRRPKSKVKRMSVYVVPGVLGGLLFALVLGFLSAFFLTDGNIVTRGGHLLYRHPDYVEPTLAPTPQPSIAETTTARTERPSEAPTASYTLPHGLLAEWTSPPADYPGLDPLDVQSDRIVPAMKPVDDSYFDDAVFIGNSILGMQMLTGKIKNATYYTKNSLQVISYFREKVRVQGGAEMTIPEALKTYEYKKVYLMLGVNEMSWPSKASLRARFDEVVKNMIESQPNAIIYIQSVMPVAAFLDERGSDTNNERVQEMNRMILSICEENDVWFLNSAEALYDENGVLPPDSSNDGIHFNRDTVARWDDYLRTHAIPIEILEKRD